MESTTKTEYTFKPTEKQKEAIEHVNGQVLVIACPGSGKTSTMLERINYMIHELNINPSQILMVAYNKKIRKEMQERFKDEYKNSDKVSFMTIHAFSYYLINKYYKKKFEVLEEEEQKSIIMQIVVDLKLQGSKKDYVEMILNDIAKLKNNLIELSNFKNSGSLKKEQFENIYHRYEDEIESRNKLDFEDMLIYANDLLMNNEKARNEIQNTYKYIIVDEFQDINLVQKEIIYQICGKNGNIAVVGDDDQSIYGFRGANPDIMLSFEKEFPNCKTIKLDTNFRSNSEIVTISENLIKKNEKRYDKKFISSRGKGAFIKFLSYTNREMELEKLIAGIKHDLSEKIDENQIAVLYRNNYQGSKVASLLSQENINFKTNDKFQTMFESMIFKDIVSFYNMAHQCGSKDDLRKTLNKPNRFLQFKHLLDNGLDKDYMISVINEQNIEQWQKNNAIKNLDDYFRLLNRIKSTNKPMDIIGIIISDGKYKEFLKYHAESFDKDYDELINMLKDILKFSSNNDTWDDFLNNVEIENKKMKESQENKTGVTLSTMHSSKGLQWEVVYIIDCIDLVYPNEKNNDLEEERRLFYVGMTRAKNKLVLMKYLFDNSTERAISRFVVECGILEYQTKPIKEYTEIKSDNRKHEFEITNIESFEKYKERIKRNIKNPKFDLFDNVEDIDEPEVGIGKIIKITIDLNYSIKAIVVKYKEKTYRYDVNDVKEFLVKKYIITDNRHTFNINYKNIPKLKIGSIVVDIEEPELGFGTVDQIDLNSSFDIDTIYVSYNETRYRYDYSSNQVNILSLVYFIDSHEEMEKINNHIKYENDYPKITIGDIVEDRFDENNKKGKITRIAIDDQYNIRNFEVKYRFSEEIYLGLDVFENELRYIGDKKSDVLPLSINDKIEDPSIGIGKIINITLNENTNEIVSFTVLF
ncbi:MAG: ATP-dependent helicase, partial [Clostridia bacterium]|nr:ATP-dependent helicase [Clostridia bacterium]